jgi:muramoyltetrapeptide carboxypeptidase LdcA involved in peptidoglycan recycling
MSFDAMFGDYARMGVLDRIAGLLVARPYGFDEQQHKQFTDVLSERVAGYAFPVVANMDFGHTTPMITMPLGVITRIDSKKREVAILESFAAV